MKTTAKLSNKKAPRNAKQNPIFPNNSSTENFGYFCVWKKR